MAGIIIGTCTKMVTLLRVSYGLIYVSFTNTAFFHIKYKVNTKGESIRNIMQVCSLAFALTLDGEKLSFTLMM